MDDLYQETVLDHYKHPRNMGWIDAVKPSEERFTAKAHHASCGDMFEISLRIHKGTITEVKWKGTGCAISTASMSMVSEWLLGKTMKQFKELSHAHILSLFGLDTISSGREKCVFFPLSFL